MQDVKYAVQYEPGRWRVYFIRENFRQVKVMSALQFSRFLSGEPYEVELTFMEWDEEGSDDVIEGQLHIEG